MESGPRPRASTDELLTEHGGVVSDTPLVIKTCSDQRDVRDASLLRSWDALAKSCPWTTCFQRPTFVTTWYATYGSTHTPLLVCGWRGDHLVGLLPLAVAVDSGMPAIAGTNQAEYQSWLAEPSDGAAFVSEALRFVGNTFPGADLTFRYLPHGAPVHQLAEAGYRSRLTQIVHRRPLMRIDGDAIAKSIAKKSNKSRFNRLKRLGSVTLDRLVTRGDLESVIDDVIWQYDLRQGAINKSSPFLEDPFKRQFHLDLMEQPGALHVTVLRIGDTVVSSHIDYVDGKWSYLGVPSHSPFYVQHSPGKLHMLLLGKMLADEEFECLDLTPGGDPWKERFANDHDDVYEVILHKSTLGRMRHGVPASVRAGLRTVIRGVGVEPRTLKKAFARVVQRRLGNGGNDVHRGEDGDLYRLEYDAIVADVGENRSLLVSVDEPRDLLRWMEGETLAAKHALLSRALTQLEQEHHLVACVSDDALKAFGWVASNPAQLGTAVPALQSLPAEGTLLHGIHVADGTEKDVERSLLRAMLATAQEQAPTGPVFALLPALAVPMLEALGVQVVNVSQAPSGLAAAVQADD